MEWNGSANVDDILTVALNSIEHLTGPAYTLVSPVVNEGISLTYKFKTATTVGSESVKQRLGNANSEA